MAEREGFEPPIALRLCLISSQVHSTGLCHLSASTRPQHAYSLPGNALRMQCLCLKAGQVARPDLGESMPRNKMMLDNAGATRYK